MAEPRQTPPTDAEIIIMQRNELKLAEQIYKHVCTGQFANLSIEGRQSIFADNYPNFLKVHFVVCKYMILYMQFNAKAMDKYMKIMRTTKARGVEDSMRVQAQYVRLLHIEQHKAAGKHYRVSDAIAAANAEEKELLEEYNRLKKMEADAKNAYAEEAKQHSISRRSDLIKFMDTHQLDEPVELSPEEIELKRKLLDQCEPEPEPQSEPAPEPQPTPEQIDPEKLAIYKARLEKIDAAEQSKWLIGTSAAPATNAAPHKAKANRKR